MKLFCIPVGEDTTKLQSIGLVVHCPGPTFIYNLSCRVERPQRRESKDDEETDSASDDEESNKPLSRLAEEIRSSTESSPETTPEKPKRDPVKVVKKVFKVIRKVKTDDGKIKKVVKIIKKIKKGEKNCPIIPGKRRVRCKVCTGCLIEEDCGDCAHCM